MENSKQGIQPAHQAASDDPSRRMASRRSLLAGSALIGAFLATNSVGSAESHAMALFPRHLRKKRKREGGGGHCYLKGTMIDTPDGISRIEDLEVGDLVTTASGAFKPVKWIARWTAEMRADQCWDQDSVPVKLARGSLDGIAPHTDLYVTDFHCLFIDGLLVPAFDLINGVNIAKALPPGADVLTYFHIELENHDVIIANGAHSETLRCAAGDRQCFDNGHEYRSLFGVEATEMQACAPIAANNTRAKVLQSRILNAISPIYDRRPPHEMIRARLAAQAVGRAA